MKALQIKTTGEIAEVEFTRENALKTLQKGVGGYVQAVDLTNDLTMWLNEEGKLEGLPHNPFAQHFWDKVFGSGTDYLVGDVVFTGPTDEDGYTLTISDEVADLVRQNVAKVREIVEPNFRVIL